MGAVATLASTALSVDPGSSTSVELVVRNNGTVVDQFSFELIGPSRSWARPDPPMLSLFPGGEGTVTVVFEPPREPGIPAGTLPFGVRVTSAEDPGGSAVEEGSIEIGAFSDVSVDLGPRALRGRWSARTQLGIDNRSNIPFRGEISASDPELALGFAFRPGLVDVAPGTVTFSKIGVTPRRRFWRGPPETRPFHVVVSQPSPVLGPSPESAGDEPPTDALPPAGLPTPPAGAPPLSPFPPPEPSVHPPQMEADGTFLQEALLPGWLPRALLGLAALVLIGVILWFSLVKPQIKAATQNQVSKQLTAAGITTTTTAPASAAKGGGSGGGAGGSKAGGGGAGSGAGGGAGSGGGSGGAGSGSGGASSSGSLGTSGVGANGTFDGSLLAAGNGTQVYTVPSGRTLSVTDLLVENPGGATGTVTLSRNHTVLMQWSMADFRDLDYHWITPTIFSAGQQLQMQVSSCSGTCTPAIYFAGTLK